METTVKFLIPCSHLSPSVLSCWSWNVLLPVPRKLSRLLIMSTSIRLAVLNQSKLWEFLGLHIPTYRYQVLKHRPTYSPVSGILYQLFISKLTWTICETIKRISLLWTLQEQSWPWTLWTSTDDLTIWPCPIISLYPTIRRCLTVSAENWFCDLNWREICRGLRLWCLKLLDLHRNYTYPPYLHII